jgi:HD superfamily phosphohydrolase YqeK
VAEPWLLPVLTGRLSRDVPAFLRLNGFPATAVHAAQVAAEARKLARRLGQDPERAAAGGWLHDCSAVIPTADRIAAAVNFGLQVLPEEARLPMILHQKLSVVVSRSVFHVRDDEVLSAVGCHTTLKAEPSQMDLVVFVADKLAWDQPGEAAYHPALRAALARSQGRPLEEAALVYLDHLWDRRAELVVLHPWAAAGRDWLRQG